VCFGGKEKRYERDKQRKEGKRNDDTRTNERNWKGTGENGRKEKVKKWIKERKKEGEG
jgi:hypothetical protein